MKNFGDFFIALIILAFFLSYIHSKHIASKQKKVYAIQKRIYQEIEERRKLRIKMIINNITSEIYSFAYKNNCLTKNHYDIEEGGHYLTAFNEIQKKIIDAIISDEIINQDKNSSEEKVSLQTKNSIENRILNEMPIKSDRYIGF